MVVSEGKLMARPLQAGRFIAVGGPRDSCSAAPAGPRQTRGRAFWLVPASCNAHHSCLRGRLGRPTALAAAAGAAGGRGRRPLVRAATCATSKIYLCARHSRLHGSTHAHPWQPCLRDQQLCSGKDAHHRLATCSFRRPACGFRQRSHAEHLCRADWPAGASSHVPLTHWLVEPYGMRW